MRNRIEIFGQIRVHHIGITRPEQFHYFPDRILGAALRSVAVPATAWRLSVPLGPEWSVSRAALGHHRASGLVCSRSRTARGKAAAAGVAICAISRQRLSRWLKQL